MLFDTDILIWVKQGHEKASDWIDREDARMISILTYMELIQGARAQKEVQSIKNFLKDLNFSILPLTENIGHRASIYMEEYSFTSGLRLGDAIIAATATENSLTLATGNQKHFKGIRDLALQIFHP